MSRQQQSHCNCTTHACTGATIRTIHFSHSVIDKSTGESLAHSVIDKSTGASLEYKHLIRQPDAKQFWTHSFTNELGRLAQGVNNSGDGTTTIQFIPYDSIPNDWHAHVTYGRIVVEYKPHNTEKHHTHLTVGGNLIEYPGNVTTPTADINTSKILFNSVISTKNA